MSLLEIFLTFWCCLILKIERMHHAVPLSDLLSGPVCSLQLHTAAFHFRHLFKDQRAASTTLWKRARVQPVETQVLSIMVLISPTMFILTANCCYWPVLCIGTHRAAVILPQLLACILNQIWYILTVFVCRVQNSHTLSLQAKRLSLIVLQGAKCAWHCQMWRIYPQSLHWISVATFQWQGREQL